MSTNPKPEREVEVYRNLHRQTWSIRGRRSRLVQGHEPVVVITDAELKVSEAGRQRVLREKRKNVHAVVRGTLGLGFGHYNHLDTDGMRRARYNPYQAPTFTDVETGDAVTRSATVVLTADGRMFYRPLDGTLESV